MRKHQNRLVIATSLACLVIINMVTAGAADPRPYVRGSAQSDNLMLTFGAVQQQDGSIDGQATFRDRATNTRVDVDIDCMMVFDLVCVGCEPGDKGALLSGVVIDSTSTEFPIEGPVGFIVKAFHGNGKDANSDQFTPLSRSIGPCTALITRFLGSERGRITINAEPAN